MSSSRSTTERIVHRFRQGAGREEQVDQLALEEPLEIRVAGDPIAITMRTPGEDHKLAIGFLFSEGMIKGAHDLGTVTHCGRLGEEGFGNTIDCIPASGARLELERSAVAQRGTLTTSACGVCGRLSIEDLVGACAPLSPGPILGAQLVASATSRLSEVQRIFERTGGTHAAVALDDEGRLIAGYEDVGRHNAVDKVVGALVLDGLVAGVPRSRAAVLAVSGRASFEIIQKAARARIPVVASVSAASSLAVDLAERMNVTLATFVRDGRLNVFTHPERISG